MIKLSTLIEEIDPVSAELGQGLGEADSNKPEIGVPNNIGQEKLAHGESSHASQEAKAKGLEYMKFGRYGKNGKVTHKTNPAGALVPVQQKQKTGDHEGDEMRSLSKVYHNNKPDQSGNLIPVKSNAQGQVAKGEKHRPIRSRNPEGPRSKTPLAQAPKGDYGNPEMGADAVARHNINRGRPADHDFSNEPEHQSDLSSYGDEEKRGTGDERAEALPTQTRIPSSNDIEKSISVYKSVDPVSPKAHLLGQVTGMLRDLQIHKGDAVKLAQYYQSMPRSSKRGSLGDSAAIRLNALNAYVNQNRGSEENPEDVPRDASGASHFGADQ